MLRHLAQRLGAFGCEWVSQVQQPIRRNGGAEDNYFLFAEIAVNLDPQVNLTPDGIADDLDDVHRVGDDLRDSWCSKPLQKGITRSDVYPSATLCRALAAMSSDVAPTTWA